MGAHALGEGKRLGVFDDEDKWLLDPPAVPMFATRGFEPPPHPATRIAAAVNGPSMALMRSR